MKKHICSFLGLCLLAMSACSAKAPTESGSTATQINGSIKTQMVTIEKTLVMGVDLSPLLAIKSHEEEADRSWKTSDETIIWLKGDSVFCDNAQVIFIGGQVLIRQAGVYRLVGLLTAGGVIVDAGKEAVVQLIFDNVSVTNPDGPAFYIKSAKKAIIHVPHMSANLLKDSSTYSFLTAEEDEPNAALFSKADLSIYGTGELRVEGNYNDAIASKDSLLIRDLVLSIHAVDDGLRGKDALWVYGSWVNVEAGGDAFKSDLEKDGSYGLIHLEESTLTLTSGGDGLDAKGLVEVVSGSLTVTSAGGATARINDELSAKGIKGGQGVVLRAGTFVLDCADDAIHSNGSIQILGGDYRIATGDDAVHADLTLDVKDGTLDISSCVEGLEASVITIDGGELRIVSSDDGVNVAGVNGSATGGTMAPGGQVADGSTIPEKQMGMPPAMPSDGRGMGTPPADEQPPMGTENMPPPDAEHMQPPGNGTFAHPGGGGMPVDADAESLLLTINGGFISIVAGGDGVDSNGSFVLNGGTLLVSCPSMAHGDSAIDAALGYAINGGLLVAAGSAVMQELPLDSSNQTSLMLYFEQAQESGTIFHLEDARGNVVLSVAPEKDYTTLLISSPLLKSGDKYTASLGGQASGSARYGLFSKGNYTGGERLAEITLSAKVNIFGTASTGFHNPGRRP